MPHHTTDITPRLMRGAHEVEATALGTRPHRLPRWARAQAADAQLEMAQSQPSGVRLAFHSSSTWVALTASATRYRYAGLPARSPGVFDLVVDGEVVARRVLDEAITVTIDPATGAREVMDAAPGRLVFDGLGGHAKSIEIWLPHTESVELVSLESDEPLHATDSERPVWLHHGSSISHGSNADRPTGTWPAVAAAQRGWDLVNLGLGGSALLDPFTARVMRDAPADLISVKIGINLVNADLMRKRAFGPAVHGFLDTIRDGHPATPLLVMTPIHCDIHEATPGPGAFDMDAMARGETRFVATGDPDDVRAGALTLAVIRDELERIVRERRESDPHLTLLDGLALYGPADAEARPLVDGLHPDAQTHREMGERFARLAWVGE